MSELKLEAKEGIDQQTINSVKSLGESYKYGFTTDIDMEYAPKGLSEEIVKLISKKNDEPEWMLNWRLEAYKRWVKMDEPNWPMLNYKGMTALNKARETIRNIKSDGLVAGVKKTFNKPKVEKPSISDNISSAI